MDVFINFVSYLANSRHKFTERTLVSVLVSLVGPKCLFYPVMCSWKSDHHDYRLSNAYHCIYFI